VVTALEPGGAAESAGVRLGDILVQVGDIPVEDQNFGARFRLRYNNAAEGSPLPMVVSRAGQRLTLNGKVIFANVGMKLEADASATPKAKRILQGILTGK
jgi:C-terminal processing protease CtpA/Prc